MSAQAKTGDIVSDDELMAQLRASSPDAANVVVQHLAEEGELLSHLLMAEFRRWALERQSQAIASSREVDDSVTRVLSILADRLTNGDDREQNAIAVSFLEHWCESPVADALRAQFPPALEAELPGREVQSDPSESGSN